MNILSMFFQYDEKTYASLQKPWPCFNSALDSFIHRPFFQNKVCLDKIRTFFDFIEFYYLLLYYKTSKTEYRIITNIEILIFKKEMEIFFPISTASMETI